MADDITTRSDGTDASSIPPPSQSAPIVRRTEVFADNYMNAEALSKLEQVVAGEEVFEDETGHKFGMPTPPGKHDKLQSRYPPIIHQFSRLLMRDGKLSLAERVRLEHTNLQYLCDDGHTKLTCHCIECGLDPQLPTNDTSTQSKPNATPPARIALARAAASGPGPLPRARRRQRGAPDARQEHEGHGRWWQRPRGARAPDDAATAADGHPVDPGRGEQEEVEGQRKEAVCVPRGRGDRRRG